MSTHHKRGPSMVDELNDSYTCNVNGVNTSDKWWMVDTSQMGPIQNNYIHNKGNIITVILLLEYFLVYIRRISERKFYKSFMFLGGIVLFCKSFWLNYFTTCLCDTLELSCIDSDKWNLKPSRFTAHPFKSKLII